jgi:hypothetical protein
VVGIQPYRYILVVIIIGTGEADSIASVSSQRCSGITGRRIIDIRGITPAGVAQSCSADRDIGKVVAAGAIVIIGRRTVAGNESHSYLEIRGVSRQSAVTA